MITCRDATVLKDHQFSVRLPRTSASTVDELEDGFGMGGQLARS
jgi:phage head maturation protease